MSANILTDIQSLEFDASQYAQYTVLVIDDTRINLKIIANRLNQIGLRVLTAASGESGLDRARLASPDIILLDVIMPGIDGFETCRRLKADERTADIPVIFMTALSETEHKVAGFDAGAVDYVTKPIQLEEVVARITTHLRINQLTRELQSTNRELTSTLDDLRETQNQLIEAEKMAALGNLVAGVAHEINTPVGIGVLAASTLACELEMLEEAYRSGNLKRSALDTFLSMSHQTTTLMVANLQRAANLVQSFKQVAVDQAHLDIRSFLVKQYLDETLFSLLPHINRTSHTIEIEGDDQLSMTSYPGALAQVITNLVMNTLTHAYPTDESGKVRFELAAQDDHVVIHYSDDGCGMPEDIRTRIFEPFFTTRRSDGGSGLGMHVVYNIVTQKLGGTIECRSAVGVGSTFVLTLPQNLSVAIQ